MKYKKIKQNVEILRSRCQPANQSRLPLSCRWVPTCCYHIQLEISQSDYLQIKLLHNFNSSKLVDVFLWLLWFDNVHLIAMIICRYLNATSCALTSPLADAMHFKIRINLDSFLNCINNSNPSGRQWPQIVKMLLDNGSEYSTTAEKDPFYPLENLGNCT